MADTAIAITAGTGTNVDTRTEGTNGNHRQVIVIGDPATNAGVAPVDATSGLKVNLGADNDVTVTGTVTAELSAVDNAVLDTIDAVLDTIKTDTGNITTAVQLIDNAISGTEMQVDVVAPLPAGTNAIGKLAANSGVDIGDVDVTSIQGGVADNAADSGSPVKVGAKYNASAPTYTDGDRADLQTDVNGNLKVTLATILSAITGGAENDTILTAPFKRSDSFQATITSADASTATSVKAKTAAKKIYVTDIIISVDTAMNVQLQDDSAGPVVLLEQMYLPANSVFSKSFITPLEVATNQDLDVITSAAGNISVTVTGYVI